jgi:gliding motility-associated-like protein
MRKIYHLFLTFVAFIGFGQLYAQQPEQDCINALPICQNVYTQPNAYSGAGLSPNEINPAISCLLSGEKNDVWYIFTVQVSGNVCFTITPNSTLDDYDWAVYNLTTANCSDIATNASLQVSCNYSGNIGCGGTTGANGGQFGPCGGQNNACIPVLAGQTYVVNVSNFSSSQSGYTIDFSASTAVIFDNIPPSIAAASNSCGSGTVSISFSENVLCNTVDLTDFTFSGPGGPYTVTGVTGLNCAAGGVSENTFTISLTPAPTLVGTYTFALVDSVTDNCGNVATLDSIDFIYPGITAIATPDSICLGAFTTLTTSLGANPVGYTFNWSGGGSGPTNVVTPTSLPATYTVTVTDAVGCVKSANVTVNLIFDPIFDFSISDTIPCDQTEVTIALTNSNVPLNSTPFWDFGGGLVTSGTGFGPYTVQWATSGPKTVSVFFLSVDGCYSDTVTHNAFVVPKPIFDFALQTNGCLNTPINLTYSGNALNTSTPNWTFPTGTNLITGTGTGPYTLSWTTSGNYQLGLFFTSVEGCTSDTTFHSIFIEPKAVFDFTISDTVTCGNAALTVNTISPAPLGTPAWNFDTGNAISGSGVGPYQVAWNTPGIYDVSLYFISPIGCISDTISHSLESIQVPSPNFTPVPPAVCFGYPIDFQYTNAIGAAQTYTWNFGATGTPATSNIQNPSSLYANAGLQSVTFSTTYRGCTSQSSQNVTVYPEAIIDAGINTTFCEGGVNLQPTILSGTNPFSFVWTSNNPNPNISNPTLQSPFVSPTITSTYYLQAVDVHNCVAKMDSVTITKYTVPAAQYAYKDNCANEVLKFTDQTTITSATLTNWSWSFGDGAILQDQNPVHKYNTPNTYTVTLYVLANNGCRDTISHLIKVLPVPQPSFSAARVCQADTTFFVDASIINPIFGAYIANWDWKLGNITTLNGIQNPTYIFPASGNYEVTLTATSDSGCVNSTSRFVEIAAIPGMPQIANDTVCFGKSAILMANATGIPSAVLWYESMTDSIPFYEGQNLSLAHLTQNITYYVQAQANSTGCRSLRKPIEALVFPKTTAEILSQDSIFFLPGAVVQFDYLSTLGLTSWTWDFGDRVTSYLEKPVHEYTYPARYPIYLLAKDENGCIVEATHTLEVKRVITSLVPSAFSPNSDGINDVLTLGMFNITSFTLEVFNRWGQKVFETSDPTKPWDGLDMSGKAVAEGAYIYTLKVQTFDNRTETQSGTITLIR